MTSGDTLALAAGIIFLLMGGIFSFASFVMAASDHEDGPQSSPDPSVSFPILLADFLLVVLDSLPLFSLFLSLRELPQAAKTMKNRWNEEPLIPRFLLIGVCLFLGGGASLWLCRL
ncbi:MAG: hypothetical protein AAF191_01425 [Verrucomicrobiota bacterium]